MSETARSRPALALTILLVLVGVWRFDQARDQLGASFTVARVQAEAQAMLATGRVYPHMVRAWVEQLRAARAANPAEVALPLAEGSLHLLARHPEAAAGAYEDALALEPRPEIWLNLGRVQLAGGDREAARESFRRALVLAPHLSDEVPPDVRREIRRKTRRPRSRAR